MPAAELARHLKAGDSSESIDLMEIPATRADIQPIDFQATLQEAMELLTRNNIEALYVTRTTVPGISRIYGVLTRKAIERSYRA
jgi:CBS domain-containing protein